MKLNQLIFTGVISFCAVPSFVHAQTSRAEQEAQKTADAVKAVDAHWGEAENHGDTTYLDQLLLPEYRSVGPAGTSAPKSRILEGAATRLDPAVSAKAVADSAAYVTSHPSEESVVIAGNTAVLTFYSKTLGLQKGIRSSDVFVYIDGRWHAIYSQHSAAQ